MRGESSPGFGIVAAAMPDIFWIGLAVALTTFVISTIAGARSRTASLRTGAAIGAYFGIMIAFPLLAIGLSNA